MATASYSDLAYVGPGTLAGQYLRLFWQPAYVGRDLLPGHAKPVRLLGDDFTLYRGEGGVPHAVAFRCAHRGTQLSTGWVEGDCIRCFYHGWKYDGSGQCVEQPAEDASFASKVRIRSYPCEEYLGLVFVYLGDAERGDTGAFRAPPLPRYPEFEDDGVLEASSYVRPCNYFNSLDNDPIHVAFVHRSTNLEPEGVPEIVECEETAYGMMVATREGGEIRRMYRIMPNVVFLDLPSGDGRGRGRIQLAWRVPVDDEHHASFNAALVRVTGEAAERYRERAQERRAQVAEHPPALELAQAVLRGELRIDDLREHPALVNIQDDVSQMGQGVIADREHERLGREDASVIRFRRIWLRELQALADGRPLKQWTWTGAMAEEAV
jgi:5,5'-dehydrodivanillate O-demethylase